MSRHRNYVAQGGAIDMHQRARQMSYVVIEIVRPRVGTKILCGDRAWGWGGRGERR